MTPHTTVSAAQSGTRELPSTNTWGAFIGWTALSIIGQLSVLSVIDAGKSLHYQHYRPLWQMWSGYKLPLALLFIQLIAVSLGCLKHKAAIKDWLKNRFSTIQLVLIALLVALSGATLSREVDRYIEEFVFAALAQFVTIGNIVLIAMAAPGSLLNRAAKFRAGLENRRKGLDLFVVAAVLWAILVPAFLNFAAYDRHPHLQDEVAYYLQGRVLATGHLTAPAPPVPEGFLVYLLETNPAGWYAVTPPGWPALLAFGFFLGVPSLVNPLLSGVSVLLAYLFLRRVYEERFARIGALLLAVSPWMLFLGMSYMNHVAVLTCGLLAAYAGSRFTRDGSLWWASIAGAAAGFAGLIRPLDGLIIAAGIGIWATVALLPKWKIGPLLCFGVGVIAVSALVLPYNAELTENPFSFPLTRYVEKLFGKGSGDLGFGPNRGLGWALDPYPGHSPRDAAINANLNWTTANQELFGWATGSLILVFLAVVRVRFRSLDLVWLASIAAVIGFYSLYYFSGGPDFAARYWFLIIIPLVVLTVRGFLELCSAAGRHQDRVLVAVGLLVFSTIFIYLPWRATDKYKNYLDMNPELLKLSRQRHFGRSLVLVRGKEFPDYASAVVYAPLDPRSDETVFAFDKSPEIRGQLLQAYADRPIQVVEGPSITHSGYKIVQSLPPGATP